MVHFTMQSADIIHSFWIPRLGGKRDVVPGQINSITYTPDEIGEFFGQCVEFCGDSHANMRLRGFVQSKADFEKWVKHQQSGPVTATTGAAADGAKIFANAPCAICHTVRGLSVLPGPFPLTKEALKFMEIRDMSLHREWIYCESAWRTLKKAILISRPGPNRTRAIPPGR